MLTSSSISTFALRRALSVSFLLPCAVISYCSTGNAQVASSLRDQSSPTNRIQASTVPTDGLLFPLGPFFFINTQGRAGFGTKTPQRTIDVVGDAVRVSRMENSPTSNPGATAELFGFRGTSTLPMQSLAGDELGVLRFGGFDGTSLVDTALIRATVSGVVGPAPGDLPVRLEFLTLQDNGSLAPRAVCDADANWGFGTSSPTAPFHIAAYANAIAGSGRTLELEAFSPNVLFHETQTQAYYRLGLANGEGSNQLFRFERFVGSPVSPIVDMVIQAGRVGIGTTVLDPSSRLHVHHEQLLVTHNHIANGKTGVFLHGNYNGTGRAAIGSTSIDEPRGPLTFVTSDVERLTILHNSGFVGIGNVAPTAHLEVGTPGGSSQVLVNGAVVQTSSGRYKENITPIASALAKVQKLQGVSFLWSSSKKQDIGLVAEAVAEVIPEVVAFEKDGQQAKGVDYARLTAVLVEAMKEQQAMIRDQSARIERLEALLTTTAGVK